MIETAQAFGVDIGGSGIKAAPVNLEKGEFAEPRLKILTPEVSTPKAVGEIVRQQLEHFEVPESAPVGIAFPAPIHVGEKLGYMANLDQSWVGVDVTEVFSEACGRPVTVVNDADAAGLAEQQFGAAKGQDGLVIATTLGTGIGTALIFNGELIPNTELGHLELLKGKGDAEKYAASSIREKLDMGYKSALTASIDAMNEISSAIISITLVMSAVFVPVSFIGGMSGTFYREFGITMAISILISAVNALTLSPALCAIFLKPKDEEAEANGGNKMSFVDRFHAGFNQSFDKITNKYKKGVERIINNRIVTGISVVAGIVALVFFMGTTKTGLIPDEDTGTLFCTISLPPSTGQDKTLEVGEKIDAMLATNPWIERREMIAGYNFIAGAGSDQATFIIKLKPFDERKWGMIDRVKSVFTGAGIAGLFIDPSSSNSVLGMIYKQTATIKGAQILAFAPPMVSGFSATNGLTFSMEDRTGGDLNKFYDVTQKFLKALGEREEIQRAMTSYNPNYPQYMVNIDVAKAKQAGTSPQAILSTMSGYFGGQYASNFNAFGKLYRVYIQGSPESRMTIDKLNDVYIRTNNGMSPINEFVTLKRTYGPSSINRFNLFTAITINATAADGYSSGQAIKAVEEVAKQTLPDGYTYEYSGLTRSEQESSSSTGMIFILCFIFVYLILSAQYESYLLPLAVLLSVPFGLAGAFIFTQLFGHSNDIYMQISLIMLIGLLAKNAILIVQFALERRQTGMAIRYAAILGAVARLRPILMTSLAMIIGLLPLMFASGVGRNGNQTLGAAAVGGMLIGTICQVFVVPSLFAIFQWLQERIKPLEFHDEENEEVVRELEQYAQGPAGDYKVDNAPM